MIITVKCDYVLAGRVSDPFISSQVNGGSVERGTHIVLDCDSPGSKIFYTIDGAPPELHLDSAKVCILDEFIHSYVILWWSQFWIISHKSELHLRWPSLLQIENSWIGKNKFNLGNTQNEN